MFAGPLRLQNRGVTRVSPVITDPASTCLRAARVVADQVPLPRETRSGLSTQSRAAPAARQTESGIAAMLPRDGLGESGIIRCG
jgi:hypothetical protein